MPVSVPATAPDTPLEPHTPSILDIERLNLSSSSGRPDTQLSRPTTGSRWDEGPGVPAAPKFVHDHATDKERSNPFAVQTPPARTNSSRIMLLATLVFLIGACLALVSVSGHLLTDGAEPAAAPAVPAVPALPEPSSPTPSLPETTTPSSTSSSPASASALISLAAAHPSKMPGIKCPNGRVVNSPPLTIVALLGPPGVGKGAFSRHLGPAHGLLHVSTGELIRVEIAAKSEIGLKVQSIVRSGGLVDDDIVVQLIEKQLKTVEDMRASGKADPELGEVPRGVILDGFPRRLSQSQLLDSGAFAIPQLAAVISFTMRDDILAERRSGRRFCPVCGRTYNLHGVDKEGYFLPPRLPQHSDLSTCSFDGAKLLTRPDDEPSVADERMASYHAETPPMIDYYKKQGNLLEIEKKRGAGVLFRTLKPKLATLVQKSQCANPDAKKKN